MNWFNVLFGFEGRINRAKFWMGWIAAIIFCYAGVLVAIIVLNYDDAVWLFIILAVWVTCAVGIKRLHDLDRSAWWLLAVWSIPGFVLALGLIPGTEGDNRFGADPLPPRGEAFSYGPEASP
jgi:uncharacterized membrane protein YhaH (DUF805 family)